MLLATAFSHWKQQSKVKHRRDLLFFFFFSLISHQISEKVPNLTYHQMHILELLVTKYGLSREVANWLSYDIMQLSSLSIFYINLINFKSNGIWQNSLFLFSLFTQNIFLRHNSWGKKKSPYFLLFYLITCFFLLILMGFLPFFLEGVDTYQPLHTAEQEARCYWVIHKGRDSRAVWKHFHSCTPKDYAHLTRRTAQPLRCCWATAPSLQGYRKVIGTQEHSIHKFFIIK